MKSETAKEAPQDIENLNKNAPNNYTMMAQWIDLSSDPVFNKIRII